MDLAVNSTIQMDLLPDWVVYPYQFRLPDRKSAEYYFKQLTDPPPEDKDPSSGQTGSEAPASPGRLMRDDFAECPDDTEEQTLPVELESRLVGQVLKNAVESTHRCRGTVPSHAEEMVKVLLEESRIPWNVLFRRLCQWASLRRKSFSKKRISKRYGTRPGPVMKQQLRLTVAFDTSASISANDLSWFFAELNAMLGTGTEICLIQCDAEIQKIETYKPGKTQIKPKVYGRGGTAFTPVFDYLLRDSSGRPDLLVYFTDGYGDRPQDPRLFPVCWVYTPQHQKAANFGTHIEYHPE